jgi:hypothetical protein
VSPVRYELGFYIPEDDILHSHHREDLKTYTSEISSSSTRQEPEGDRDVAAADARDAVISRSQQTQIRLPSQWQPGDTSPRTLAVVLLAPPDASCSPLPLYTSTGPHTDGLQDELHVYRALPLIDFRGHTVPEVPTRVWCAPPPPTLVQVRTL